MGSVEELFIWAEREEQQERQKMGKEVEKRCNRRDKEKVVDHIRR